MPHVEPQHVQRAHEPCPGSSRRPHSSPLQCSQAPRCVYDTTSPPHTEPRVPRPAEPPERPARPVRDAPVSRNVGQGRCQLSTRGLRLPRLLRPTKTQPKSLGGQIKATIAAGG